LLLVLMIALVLLLVQRRGHLVRCRRLRFLLRVHGTAAYARVNSGGS
jgi:hypothetical protein